MRYSLHMHRKQCLDVGFETTKQHVRLHYVHANTTKSNYCYCEINQYLVLIAVGYGWFVKQILSAGCTYIREPIKSCSFTSDAATQLTHRIQCEHPQLIQCVRLLRCRAPMRCVSLRCGAASTCEWTLTRTWSDMEAWIRGYNHAIYHPGHLYQVSLIIITFLSRSEV